MELKISERIILQGILPNETNYLDLKIIQKLRQDLSFSEQEHKELNFEVDGEQIKWNSANEKLKEIEIGDRAKTIIKEALQKMDKDGKINLQNIQLYEKFVIEN